MQAHSLSFRAADWLDGPLGLAHDAGNLLNALGLYCDLLEAPEVLRSEHQHYVTELRSIARRSAELLARLSGTSSSSAALRGNLARLSHFEGILRQICGPKCALSFEVGEFVAPLLPDIEDMERIVLNLVRNAVEALEKQERSGAAVKVTLREDGGELLLVVEDNGPGLELQRALNFFQVESDVVPGSRGLGHRIVRELARETGASVTLRSGPGCGSCFEFRWKSEVRRAC